MVKIAYQDVGFYLWFNIYFEGKHLKSKVAKLRKIILPRNKLKENQEKQRDNLSNSKSKRDRIYREGQLSTFQSFLQKVSTNFGKNSK